MEEWRGEEKGGRIGKESWVQRREREEEGGEEKEEERGQEKGWRGHFMGHLTGHLTHIWITDSN